MGFETVTIGPCTLYRGDCLAVMAELHTDAVAITVTSPPYNTLPTTHAPSGLHGQRKSGVNQWIKRASENYFDTRPEPEYQQWVRDVVAECLRVSRGLVWVNHKVRYRDGKAVHPVRFLPFDLYAEVIWDRRVSMALNCKRFAPSHEGLWAFGSPHIWNDDDNGLMSVWPLGFDRDPNEHPCAFPLEIARRPIAASSAPDDVVLDCFGGSFTTGVACIREGRRFVGCENDSKNFDDGCKRIERAWQDKRSEIPFEKPAPMRQRELIGA